MKIENKEQTIELDRSVHVSTGAKNVRAHNHLTKNKQQARAELCQAQVKLG